MTNGENRRNMDGWDHNGNDGAYLRQPVQVSRSVKRRATGR